MAESLVAVRPAPDALALLAAVEADADALADSLHDGPLQALVVARYAADAAVRGGDASLARDAVQEALVAMRRTLWQLRPRGAEDLPAALADLSGQRVAAGEHALALDLDLAVAAALPAPARVVAYRFVQAVAGAGAGVRLAREGARAVLSVTAPVADPASWAARAAAVGGELTDGTSTSCLLLPLPDTDPEGER